MILSFIYIKNYRNLRNINFNFGGKHNINYIKENKTLEIYENTNYIDDFFNIKTPTETNYAKISLVSAIIGENGTGKTSFLDCIKENLIEGGDNNFDGIIVFEDQKENYINIFAPKSISIKNKNILKSSLGYRINIHEYKNEASTYLVDNGQIIIENVELKNILKQISYVYLSNIFDKKEEFEYTGLFNLSTNFLIRNDFNIKLENKQIAPENDVILEHRISEIHRELNFISNFKNNLSSLINFELPSQLSARLVPLFNFEELKSRNKSISSLFKTLDGLYTKAEIEIYTYDHFVYNLFKTSLYNLNNELYKYSINGPYIFFDESKIIINNNLIDSPIELIHSILDQYINESITFPEIQKKLEAIKSMVSLIFEYVKIKKNTAYALNFIFHIKNNEEEAFFFEFFDYYKNTYHFDSYINFDWTDLSTGQKAMLNIYSRLYSISEKELSRTNSNSDLKNNIILLIDEGELYLHPTWQKEILFQLLKVIPQIFNSSNINLQRNIQIILTSNSPLIISDIPASNIVFLKKKFNNSGGSEVVNDKLSDHKLTFASNIHTLLANSFFMENGLIGAFAAFKINEVIELLLGDINSIEKNKDRITSLILLIGEPVIKTKLLHMLNDRLSLNLINLNQRVLNLENRINTKEG